ncbi:MAG: hypothetical protein JWN88_1345, partial [Frankiales bacterium]|nr:hypothetical protein [Frankiales bacterium]
MREPESCGAAQQHHALGADAVKVGTWARSKGMEFAHVFLPQVDRTTQLLTGAG